MRLWRELNPSLRGFAILAVIAGVITAASGESALFALFVLLRIAFLLAMLWFAYTVWRNHRVEISTWPLRPRVVLYGAALLIVADLLVYFFRHVAGPDALAFFLVLGGAGYALWRTWRDQHTYS
jgi:hypothetical protein